MNTRNIYKHHRFPPEIISHCVWLYWYNDYGELACYMLTLNGYREWHDPGAASSAGRLYCKDHQTLVYDFNAQTAGCYIAPIALPQE